MCIRDRSWDFQKDGKKNRSTGEDHGTGYQGYAGAKGNDLRNGNFQRNGTGRKDTNHQNSDLALYLPTNGIKVGGILKTVFGGITTGVFEMCIRDSTKSLWNPVRSTEKSACHSFPNRR